MNDGEVYEQEEPTETAQLPPLAGEGGAARCGYSRCRKPLPESTGRGRRRDYCAETETTWPVGDRRVGCRELGAAERLIRAAGGGDTSPALSGPNLAALSETVDEVLAAVEPVTALQRTLTAVRTQLNEEVATVRAEADAADARAADDRAAAEEARRAKEQAEADAATARATAERAETKAEADREARAAAERNMTRAEGSLAALESELAETRARLGALTDLRDQAERNLAARTAELDAATATIDRLRGELAEATNRAHQLVGEHHAERERSRAEQQRELDALRQEHEQRLDRLRAEHERAVAAQRKSDERQRVNLAERHANALSELHQQLGALTQQHQTAAERAETATARLATLRAGLAELVESEAADRPAKLTALLAAADGPP